MPVRPTLGHVTSATSPARVDPASFDWASSSGVAEGVRRVVAAATETDGRSPLNEAALLSLRHSGLSGSTLWVAGPADADLDGFALLSDSGELNLVVAPSARGKGIGGALAGAALKGSDGEVSAWSHGNHPAAAALAERLGLDRVRDLWVMRRSLMEPLPEVTVPTGIVVRPFEPGRDEDAFLATNVEAFIDHPEQGSMTRADLEQRMAEDWFDPAGFFLAEPADAVPDGDSSVDSPPLLGFHWTKVHPGNPAYGEVYVVGVSPVAQGSGLGKALTLTGLHHLRSLGLAEVILYVESDNAPAVAVYRGLGFTHADQDTDVMYLRPARP